MSVNPSTEKEIPPTAVVPPEHKPLLLILAKSPVPRKGRGGNEDTEDWMWPVKAVTEILRQDKDADAFIVTAFTSKEDGREADYYVKILTQKFHIPNSRILFSYEGLETIDQIDAACCFAQKERRPLFIFCTPLHYARVKFICEEFNFDATVIMAPQCIPRESEAYTDALLTVLFPVICRIPFGVQLFQWYARRRRTAGEI